ncbi:host-nuclease inhibitor Gam family protein [Fundidesulfovibrio putealis]|uniref:host-nuclease inhibitor Gam family protein n=1 Tax=Fundidesulfovibrio putealis TaxID=270496 RepID=UPI00040E4490|nr:host-nuclease inhibitor Gam family protein [Fundidesulfovibrio putealis]
MARRKPDETQAITSLDAADAALVELAKLDREMRMIEICLNEDIEAARKRADELAAPLREKRRLLESALTTYATASKEALFKKGKSIKLTHGVFGFRASDELKPLPKGTWKEVLGKLNGMAAKLAKLELPGCIRIKEEPDKEALRKLPEDLRAEAGVRIVGKDTFYYELKDENVAVKAA